MKKNNNFVSFCLIFLILFMLIQFFEFRVAYAGLFGSSIPKGKEIKDPYLEKLFAPEFPYESINIVDTEEGKRYLVIKANAKVTEKKRIDYEKNTLRSRGIVVYRSGSPRTDTLLISEMRLYRVVSEMPYVVEYSEVIGKQLEGKYDVESVVRDEGKYLIVLIDKEFGKGFKQIELYPATETKCPEPPFVGKYPNSKSISCKGGDKGVLFIYVTKDKGQQIYNYYKDTLKAHYKKVGFNFPEESWKYSGALHNLGMQIESSEVAKMRTYFDPARKSVSIKSIHTSNGVVFNISITEIGLKPIIEEYSLIRIFYSTDRESINTNIERMQKRYQKEMK